MLKLFEDYSFFKGGVSAQIMPLNIKGLDCPENEIRNSEYLDTCLFRKLGMSNEMRFNNGIERGLTRLLLPGVADDLKGFGGYGLDVDNNFYFDYYDGSAKEFKVKYSTSKNFERDRHIIGKISNDGKLSLAVISPEGFKSIFVLLNKATSRTHKSYEMHSSSAIMFAVAAYAVSLIENGILKSSDRGYEVCKTIYDHYLDVVNNLKYEDNEFKVVDEDVLIPAVRCLDNDIYSVLQYDGVLYSQGLTNFIKPSTLNLDKFEFLAENSFPRFSNFKGDSVVLNGTKVLSNEGGYVPDSLVENSLTVGELIIDSDKWSMNESRRLSDSEKAMVPCLNELIPCKKVLDVARLIKASNRYKKPFRNIALEGETGSGKTTAAKMLAQLLNLPYTFITFNPDTLLSDLTVNVLPSDKSKESKEELDRLLKDLPTSTEVAIDPSGAYEKLTGIKKGNVTEEEYSRTAAEYMQKAFSKAMNDFVYVKSEFVLAMEHGWAIELQETNYASKPGVLAGLNSALDDCQSFRLINGETVRRHKDTVVFMTYNAGYEGTKRLNQALLSRFQLKLSFELPKQEDLMQMVMLESGYKDEKVISKMLSVMNSIRKELFDNGVNDGSCGVREVINWAEATDILGSPYKAAMYTIVPSATNDKEIEPSIVQALRTQFMEWE